MRLFIDTNVLFDVVAQREPFFEASKKLFIMQAYGDAELWAAPQSCLDIFYVLKKVRPADEVQKALAHVLDRVSLCATGHADMQAALSAGWNDAEDALIGVSARKVSADYLITRDEEQRGFEDLEMPTYTPEAFFAHLQSEYGVTYDMVQL